MGRPLLKSATARIVGSATSGFVPASELDDGSSDLWLDDGSSVLWLDGSDREVHVCFFLFFREVLSTLAWDLCGFFLFYGVHCNNLYLHRLDLI
jgi:hypothetical protein